MAPFLSITNFRKEKMPQNTSSTQGRVLYPGPVRCDHHTEIHTEIWEHPLWKSTGEGAQNSVPEGFYESQLSFIKVQLQSDDIWHLIVIIIIIIIVVLDRFSTFFVYPINVTKTPKTTLWIHFVKFFAVHCFPHHSQRPVIVISHLYVPAVQTRAEAL